MKRQHPSLIIILLIVVCAGSVHAQTDTLRHIALDDAVVSASKFWQSQSSQPKQIDVIRPEDVLFANPQTAADLLTLSRGVYVQKSQLGGGSPMMRGMATNRLLYSVDGVRMNTAIFRSGNLQNVISLDPFAIERTEVVYGPGSVIYGSDAMGGVMSFTTLDPRFASAGQRLQVGGTAVARYASAAGEMTGHFDIRLGGRRWASVTSLSSSHFGDLRQGRYGPDEYLKPWLVEHHSTGDVAIANPDPLVQSPSGYNQINLMQKLAYRPTPDWTLQYALHYSTTSDYARYDRHTRMKKGLPQYGEWNYGPQVWMMNQLTVQHSGSTPLYDQMTLRLAAQHFEESRIDRRFSQPLRTTTREGVEAYSASADFEKRLGHHTLCYGLEYVLDDVTSRGTAINIDTQESQPALARYPQAVWQSYATYAQVNLQLLRNLNLEAGLRYNHYSLSADFSNLDLELGFDPRQRSHRGSLSGSVGLSYRPWRRWLFTLSATRGFRTPNVDDMGKLYESVEGCVVVPNPGLRPEYIHSVEVGTAATLARWLHFDVAAYYSNIANAFVRRPFTLDGHPTMMYRDEEAQILAIQNAASAYVAGLELSLRGDLYRGLGYHFSLVYQYGREELDDGSRSTLRHAVPLYGRGGLSYRWRQLRMELSCRFQAQRSADAMPESERSKTEIYALTPDGRVYSPAWSTLDVRLQYQPTRHLILNASVENLLDRRYRTYTSGISAPGRNFIASVAYRF